MYVAVRFGSERGIWDWLFACAAPFSSVRWSYGTGVFNRSVPLRRLLRMLCVTRVGAISALFRVPRGPRGRCAQKGALGVCRRWKVCSGAIMKPCQHCPTFPSSRITSMSSFSVPSCPFYCFDSVDLLVMVLDMPCCIEVWIKAFVEHHWMQCSWNAAIGEICPEHAQTHWHVYHIVT